MDRTERFYKIERMLRNRKVAPIRDFLDELGVSPATFRRDIEYLRERLNAPIPWDREKGGFRLYDPDPGNPRHELPGLWFNSSEIHALPAFHRLLDRLQSGLLTPRTSRPSRNASRRSSKKTIVLSPKSRGGTRLCTEVIHRAFTPPRC